MGWIWTFVLNAVLGLAGYLTSRHGFRQPSGWPRTLAAALLGWGWLTIGIELLGTLGLLHRGPLLGWSAAGLLIGFACRATHRKAPEQKENGPTDAAEWSWEEVVAGGLALWAAVLLGAQSLFLPVKVMTDGPIYHLYFSARWWKSGRLDLIAAPFGENAATYFPAVGDLWFTWLMVGWGGDRLAKIGQSPFLLLAALAAFATCRKLRAGRAASVVALAWFVTCTPFLITSFEANVDTIMVAGYLLATYFFLRYADGDDGRASLILGALAAGLAVATKAPAVVFVPPLLALAAALAVRRERGAFGKAFGVLLVLLVPFTVAGFWWGRNLILTGNPLYPLHLSAFGRVWLPGWYGPEAMHRSPYYIPIGAWRSGVDILFVVIDPRLAPFWLAALAGAWAFGNRERDPERRWVGMASGLAVLNIALFWALIPYRTQYRFMYHALGLATVPLARGLDRSRVVRWLGVGLLAIHMLTRGAWPFGGENPPWDLDPRIPNKMAPLIPVSSQWQATPRRLVLVASTLLVGLMAFATVLAFRGASAKPSMRSRAWAGLAVVALVGVTTGVLYPWGADDRQTFFAGFPDFYRGWLALDQRSGPGGARVAYAGTDLPYFLMGAGLRNEVRYVNINAHPDWLPHDFHLATTTGSEGPATWPDTRPGWDRVRPDYGAWLDNLRAERIQLLVVTRINKGHGPDAAVGPEGFPIERTWADTHPETFEPVYGDEERDRLFRIYRVRRGTAEGFRE